METTITGTANLTWISTPSRFWFQMIQSLRNVFHLLFCAGRRSTLIGLRLSNQFFQGRYFCLQNEEDTNTRCVKTFDTKTNNNNDNIFALLLTCCWVKFSCNEERSGVDWSASLCDGRSPSLPPPGSTFDIIYNFLIQFTVCRMLLRHPKCTAKRNFRLLRTIRPRLRLRFHTQDLLSVTLAYRKWVKPAWNTILLIGNQMYAISECDVTMNLNNYNNISLAFQHIVVCLQKLTNIPSKWHRIFNWCIWRIACVSFAI